MDLTKHMRFQSVRLVGAVGIELNTKTQFQPDTLLACSFLYACHGRQADRYARWLRRKSRNRPNQNKTNGGSFYSEKMNTWFGID
jgi:hypothetical protein